MPPIPEKFRKLATAAPTVPVKPVATPPPTDPLSGWQPGTVMANSNEGDQKVACELYGGMAVHLSFLPERHGVWTLTVVTVGLRVLHADTEADCCRAGKYLWDKFCLALRLKTKEEIVARLPSWVSLWAAEFRKQRRWVDPTPFIEKEKQ